MGIPAPWFCAAAEGSSAETPFARDLRRSVLPATEGAVQARFYPPLRSLVGRPPAGDNGGKSSHAAGFWTARSCGRRSHVRSVSSRAQEFGLVARVGVG